MLSRRELVRDRNTGIFIKTTSCLAGDFSYTFLVTPPSALRPQSVPFDWSSIDDVLLDMDGTLLDRHFDNFFFEDALPRRYAALQGLPFEEARERLMAMYRSVERELAWTDLHYWTGRVGIDVVALHRELSHMIGFLPGAERFLLEMKARGKRVTILTNAHRAGVEIKSDKTGLHRLVDRIVDAFEVGYLKMRPEYWPACRRLVGFDPGRSLYVDDDEDCLSAARQFGLAHVVHSAKSSSELPPSFSRGFHSITDLPILLNGAGSGP
ncbi:MAG TPA: HAD family hydrolase [Nitrospira sp.]|nr:HAD family hydrolase [Nitrospira sp.]